MPAEGDILAGRYRLLSRLGQGGMGAVWRAEHLGLNSVVAIKLIDEEVVKSEETLARFEREAHAAASLRMSNVVQILDYGVDGQTPYIAMELLEGESLSARLERESRLAPEQAAPIISQVGRALSRAHELGVVHRDLKPDNIFLVRDGDQEIAKVLDFGIAKTSTDTADSLLSTSTGALLGTPYYMSPEQAMAKGDVDHLTDLWALGVLAFECITGHRPFDGPSIGAIVVAICSEPLPIPSTLSEVPAGFDDWFATTCCRDRDARFRTAAEATAAFRRLCGVDFSRSSFSSIPGISLKESIPPGVVHVKTVLGSVGPSAGAGPSAGLGSSRQAALGAGLASAQGVKGGRSDARLVAPNQVVKRGPRTILGGTPEPSLLTLHGRALHGLDGRVWAPRKRLLWGIASGVLAVSLLVVFFRREPDEESAATVVAFDSGNKDMAAGEHTSPVIETDALTLDDLTLETSEDRKAEKAKRRSTPRASSRRVPSWLAQQQGTQPQALPSEELDVPPPEDAVAPEEPVSPADEPVAPADEPVAPVIEEETRRRPPAKVRKPDVEERLAF